MEYVKDPKMIEIKSFEIIQGIIDDIRPGYKFKNEIEEKIIKRSIHTTADGCTIYTDTNMALSGINKMKLNALGCEYKCLVADERVKELAKEKGITRSMAAIEVAMFYVKIKFIIFTVNFFIIFFLYTYSISTTSTENRVFIYFLTAVWTNDRWFFFFY